MNALKKHKIFSIILVSVILSLFAFTFWPFVTELMLAALFAFALQGLFHKVTKKNIQRKYASLILTLGVLVFIATPVTFVTYKTITAVKEYSAVGIQNTKFFQSTEKMLLDLTKKVTRIADRFDMDTSKLPNPTDFLTKYSGEIGSYATAIITKVPEILLSLFVFFLALYYFLNESNTIKSQFLKFDLLPEVEVNKIVRILKRSSYTTLIISLLIAALQAFVVTVFAYFCGFTDFFIIFVVTAIFSLVPVVGSAPVPLFLMLISLMQGNSGIAIAMLVAAITAGSVDNLVKPIILSSTGEDFSPILSLFTLIGAILVYGAVGLLIGPIITQLALSVLEILKPDENSGEILADSDL